MCKKLNKMVFKERLFFLFLFFLYLLSLFSKFYRPADCWVNNYLADFLCIPIVLYISRGVIRWIKKRRKFQFSLIQVLFAIVYFSILFEFIFPQFSDRYTSDYIDILMYLAGGGLYVLISKITSR